MATTTDPSTFARNVLSSFDVATEKSVVALDGVVFVLYAEILGEWPVDTGRSRASWAIGVEVGTEVEPAGKDSYQVPKATQFVARLEGQGIDKPRFIYNNVEYAVWVNFGTSKMAGKHKVEAAIAKVKAIA